jgi:protocatechuate 3,4-dioxygenase, beta subunit
VADLILRRRKLLHGSLTLAGTAWLLGSPRSAAATLPPTPQQTAGPFYPLSLPQDSDNDLVHVSGHAESANGIVTHITGRILDPRGRPISGARVEIWQCDANGRYHYVKDGGSDRPRDENFQGYGAATTDATGGYQFLTVRPVPYPGRTPHIHFAILAPGFERFITQMYVAGEPTNAADPVLMAVRDPAVRKRLASTFILSKAAVQRH